MAENKNCNEPKSEKDSDSLLREWLLERSDLLLGAILSALAILAYPASLVTLEVQLAGYYGFGYWTALYIASSVPATLVIGKIGTVFLCSLFSVYAVWNLCVFGFGYKAYQRAAYNEPGNPFGLEDPDKPKRRDVTTFGQLSFTYSRIGVIGLALLIPNILFPSFVPDSWFNLAVYLAFLLLSLLGAYLSTPVVARAFQQNSRRLMYRGMVIVYAASVLAAVPLAGLGSPALPTAEMDLGGQEQTVSLLSHSDGYWHVIDQDKAIVHIPDDDVEGTVKVTGVIEKPGY